MQRKQFFFNCGHIKTTVTYPVKLSDIYETLDDHIKLVKILIVIDMLRKCMKDKIQDDVL